MEDYQTARLTEDVPEPEDIVDVLYEGEHVDFTVTEKQYGGFYVKVGTGLSPDMQFDVRETPQNPTNPTPGIWITITAQDNPDKYTLVYKASETVVSKVPDKYIIPETDEGKMQMRKKLGLYYEENGKVEKTTPLVTDQEVVEGYYKISDDAPAKEDIKGIITNGGSVSDEFNVTEYEGYYSIDIASLWTLFVVVLTEWTTGSTTLNPGIYILASTYGSLNQQLVYEALGTTVSKVPEKFLPAMGDEVEGNPEVPQGTSPTALQNVRINDDYFSIPQGGGDSVMRVSYTPDYADDFAALVRYGWTEEQAQKVLAGTVKSIVVGSQGSEVLSVLYVSKLTNTYQIIYATGVGAARVSINYGASTFTYTESATTWWNS